METNTLILDNLLMGEDVIAMQITVGASQTIQRGDLLALAETPTASHGTGAVTGGTANLTTGAVTGATANVGDGTISVAEAVSFVRPSAKADLFSVYVVAAEDVTTAGGETATITAYLKGEFNEDSMRFGGVSTADDNRFALAKQGIVLRNPIAA